MTIFEAQQVQRRLTDKFVVVQEGVPELRRFQGLTGTVKTVNMSGRALVQFDGPVDIGWYDIDPSYLVEITAPLPKKTAGHEAKHAPKATPAAATAAAPPKTAAGGKSPLDQIRKGAAAAPASAPAGKPSPLDLIRQQGAKTTSADAAPAPADSPAAAAPPPAPATPPAGMSPLDLIRKQGGAKK